MCDDGNCRQSLMHMSITEYMLLNNKRINEYLRRHVWGLQAKFMHDPTSFDSIRSSVPIKHQSLSHSYDFPCYWIEHCTIFPCGFPVTRCRRTIGSVTCGVFAVSEAEEVPLVGVQLCHLFKSNMAKLIRNNLIKRNKLYIY